VLLAKRYAKFIESLIIDIVNVGFLCFEFSVLSRVVCFFVFVFTMLVFFYKR